MEFIQLQRRNLFYNSKINVKINGNTYVNFKYEFLMDDSKIKITCINMAIRRAIQDFKKEYPDEEINSIVFY